MALEDMTEAASACRSNQTKSFSGRKGSSDATSKDFVTSGRQRWRQLREV